MQQAFILTNHGLVYWRIYASFGLSELSRQGINRNGIDGIGNATCRVITLWIWSSSVEQNPRYDMKCEYIFYHL